jgi:hypothetical protein
VITQVRNILYPPEHNAAVSSVYVAEILQTSPLIIGNPSIVGRPVAVGDVSGGGKHTKALSAVKFGGNTTSSRLNGVIKIICVQLEVLP